MRCAAHCPLEASWRTENGDHFTCLVMQFACSHVRLVMQFTCLVMQFTFTCLVMHFTCLVMQFACSFSHAARALPVSTRRPCAQHTVTRTYVLVTSLC